MELMINDDEYILSSQNERKEVIVRIQKRLEQNRLKLERLLLYIEKLESEFGQNQSLPQVSASAWK